LLAWWFIFLGCKVSAFEWSKQAKKSLSGRFIIQGDKKKKNKNKSQIIKKMKSWIEER